MACTAKVSSDPSATRRVVTSVTQLGSRFDSRTTTSNSCGTATTPSLTATLTRLVLGPWASVGCHSTTPLVLTMSPSGPLSRLKIRGCTGRSASVAFSAMLSRSPSVTRRIPGFVHTGGWFLSRTMIWNWLVVAAMPSEAKTLTRLVLGPWASVGCQVRMPLVVTVRPIGPSASP